MDNTKPTSEKRRQQISTYQATLYRSTFAMRKGLEVGLTEAVAKSGANSVSDMLSRIAASPEAAAAALRPVFDAQDRQAPARVTMKSIMDEVKSGELSPEELAAAIAAAKAAKAAAQ